MTYEIAITYKSASCTMTVWEDENTATISSLAAEFRERGHGTGALRRAIMIADELGVNLILRVCAYGPEPKLSNKKLKKFYRKYGFVSTSRDVMVRTRVEDDKT